MNVEQISPGDLVLSTEQFTLWSKDVTPLGRVHKGEILIVLRIDQESNSAHIITESNVGYIGLGYVPYLRLIGRL